MQSADKMMPIADAKGEIIKGKRELVAWGIPPGHAVRAVDDKTGATFYGLAEPEGRVTLKLESDL